MLSMTKPISHYVKSALPANGGGRYSRAAVTFAKYLSGVTLKAYTPKTITVKSKLAAELRKAHKQGYALVDEELELGLHVAAKNTGVHSSRLRPKEMILCLLPVLQQGAERLGQPLN